MKSKNYGLLTLRRAENTDYKWKFCEIIDFVNSSTADMRMIFPLHLRTKKAYRNLKIKYNKHIEIISPIGYFDILMLIKYSKFIMTDSGGMQKEAFFLNVPSITLRDETEWRETVDSRWNMLYKNYKGINEMKRNYDYYYGDGRAAERIVNTIMEYLPHSIS